MIALVSTEGLDNEKESFKHINESFIINIRFSTADKVGIAVFVSERESTRVISREQVAAMIDCLDDMRNYIVSKALGIGQG